MIATKNTATVIHGFYVKKVKGVELTEVATSKKWAKYLESDGWERKW